MPGAVAAAPSGAQAAPKLKLDELFLQWLGQVHDGACAIFCSAPAIFFPPTGELMLSRAFTGDNAMSGALLPRCDR